MKDIVFKSKDTEEGASCLKLKKRVLPFSSIASGQQDNESPNALTAHLQPTAGSQRPVSVSQKAPAPVRT